jgi:DnaA family protein
LPLALRFPPDQRFDTFHTRDPVVLAPLRDAARRPDGQRLYVAGPRSVGKTHLLLAVCAEAEAQGWRPGFLPLAGATGRLQEALEALHEHDLVALDSIEAIAGDRAAEVALFDFHNRAHDAGTCVVYAGRDWPDGLGLGLPDLRSRLGQCVRIALPALDDDGRAEVLRLRAARRGLQMDQAAIDWLLRRAGRDLSSLTATFDRIDRAALAAQRRVTVPFLRQLLGGEV